MKQFFEQYGAVALGILALLVLIAMITPVGNIIKTSLQDTVQTFGTRIDNQTDTMAESMKKVLINTEEFTGFNEKGELYYKGKQILPGYTLNTSKNALTNGTETYNLRFDVNVISPDGTYYSTGIDGLNFILYKNNSPVMEEWIDYCENMSENGFKAMPQENYKLVITSKPENIETEKDVYEFTINDMLMNLEEEHKWVRLSLMIATHYK